MEKFSRREILKASSSMMLLFALPDIEPMRSRLQKNFQDKKVELEMNDEAEGIYFLSIKTENAIVRNTIVKR